VASRVRTIGLGLIVCLTTSSCSAVFAQRPVRDQSETLAPEAPEQRCVSTIALPILDSVEAAAGTVAATGSFIAGAGNRTPDQPSAFGLSAIHNGILDGMVVFGVASVFWAVIFAGSAWYGFTHDCS
jgi:hypothetical protein